MITRSEKKKYFFPVSMLLFVVLLVSLYSCQNSNYRQEMSNFTTKSKTENGYTYEYVEGDPSKTRIYSLKNGLKVYLSDYEDEPRMEVRVAVKAGGKNDPSNNTGLAHYLEHMMFKGNDLYGTIDYESESKMLDSIEVMFNHYTKLTDSIERKKYYKKIDAYSNETSKYAIANEYDRLITLIGGEKHNAYTTEDRTVYTVNIPSNELERFLKIESTRFKKVVNRLFHTELEAVYEEKNRSLDNDQWKVHDVINENLFKKHPYGTQTVIGTVKHLKNPSITEIKKYFDTHYVPNNVAICISGDLDYAETIKLVDTFFGDWKPNKNLKVGEKIEEKPLEKTIKKEVFGPSQEFLTLAYRFGGFGSEDYRMLLLCDMILNNSKAGILDLNLVQKQTVLSAASYTKKFNDYTIHKILGYPKQNQSLEEVEILLLEQIEKLKKGKFDDWLLEAIINDFKKSKILELEANRSRVRNMVMTFTNSMSWVDQVTQIQKIESITKQNIMDFATKKYKNYVAVYKKTGEDPNKLSVEKPRITQVALNRDAESEFYNKIKNTPVQKLQPVFLDFDKDIHKSKINNMGFFVKKNKENELFILTYMIDVGAKFDKKIPIAVQYLNFIGTTKLSAEDFQKELYKIGCEMDVHTSSDRTFITLSGLDENMKKGSELLESILKNPKVNEEAFEQMIERILKSREDNKKNKRKILWKGLMNYGFYGEKNPFNDVLSNEELRKIKATDIISTIKSLVKYKHHTLYYGPRENDEIYDFLADHHHSATDFINIPKMLEYEEEEILQSIIYFVDYDMVQTEMLLLVKGTEYDSKREAIISLYDQYFSDILFQDIRESKGLAYSVFSRYIIPQKKKKSEYAIFYLGVQADKQEEALQSAKKLITEIPQSENNFTVAKQGILSNLESERITKNSVLTKYVVSKDKGLKSDLRKDIYDKVKTYNLSDVVDFHNKNVKDKPMVLLVLGSKEKIDFDNLKKYGKVKELTLTDLFGY